MPQRHVPVTVWSFARTDIGDGCGTDDGDRARKHKLSRLISAACIASNAAIDVPLTVPDRPQQLAQPEGSAGGHLAIGACAVAWSPLDMTGQMLMRFVV